MEIFYVCHLIRLLQKQSHSAAVNSSLPSTVFRTRTDVGRWHRFMHPPGICISSPKKALPAGKAGRAEKQFL